MHLDGDGTAVDAEKSCRWDAREHADSLKSIDSSRRPVMPASSAVTPYIGGATRGAAGLSALEVRLPLLHERRHRLGHVLGSEVDVLAAGFVLECLIHRHRERV